MFTQVRRVSTQVPIVLIFGVILFLGCRGSGQVRNQADETPVELKTNDIVYQRIPWDEYPTVVLHPVSVTGSRTGMHDDALIDALEDHLLSELRNQLQKVPGIGNISTDPSLVGRPRTLVVECQARLNYDREFVGFLDKLTQLRPVLLMPMVVRGPSSGPVFAQYTGEAKGPGDGSPIFALREGITDSVARFVSALQVP